MQLKASLRSSRAYSEKKKKFTAVIIGRVQINHSRLERWICVICMLSTR